MCATEYFDLSMMKFEYLDLDKTLKISGNATTNWNIQKTDRIQILAIFFTTPHRTIQNLNRYDSGSNGTNDV